MEYRERFDKGMARRRKVLGNAWVDKANAGKNAFNSEFQDFITRYAWGEVWTRPGLSRRTRSLLPPVTRASCPDEPIKASASGANDGGARA